MFHHLVKKLKRLIASGTLLQAIGYFVTNQNEETQMTSVGVGMLGGSGLDHLSQPMTTIHLGLYPLTLTLLANKSSVAHECRSMKIYAPQLHFLFHSFRLLPSHLACHESWPLTGGKRRLRKRRIGRPSPVLRTSFDFLFGALPSLSSFSLGRPNDCSGAPTCTCYRYSTLYG